MFFFLCLCIKSWIFCRLPCQHCCEGLDTIDDSSAAHKAELKGTGLAGSGTHLQKLEWVLQVRGAIESKDTVLRDADAWIRRNTGTAQITLQLVELVKAKYHKR